MSLDNVQPGDKLTADAWNQLVAAARSKATFRGGNGLGVKNMPNGMFVSGEVTEHILAEIVCCGDCGQGEGCTDDDVQEARNTDKSCSPQDDDGACCKPTEDDGCELEQFSDPRYWCVFSTIDPATFCSPMSTTMRDPCDDVKWKKVVAYNLAEDNCQSHLLPPGTIVELSKGYTTQTPPQEVYWFTRTPMPKAKDVDECSDRHCDCPSSSSSESSQSSSQSSHSQSESSHSQSHSSQSVSHSQSQSHSNSSPSHSSPSNSNSNSNSTTPSTNPSESGSNKSTAIVPASWSKSGYTALFISEAPEVRFDDVIIKTIPQRNCSVPIDPKFLEVCDSGSVQVCGCVADEPIAVGAKVKGGNVELRFAAQAEATLQVVIRLTGIRKGFNGMRFPDRTKEQFVKNEAFINSAY